MALPWGFVESHFLRLPGNAIWYCLKTPIADATWDGQSAMYVLDPSAAAPSSSAQHLAYHSFGAQPQGASYQPYNFDFSQLFGTQNQASATASASAYATNAAQFAQQFAQQIATAPPVNPQVRRRRSLSVLSAAADVFSSRRKCTARSRPPTSTGVAPTLRDETPGGIRP